MLPLQRSQLLHGIHVAVSTSPTDLCSKCQGNRVWAHNNSIRYIDLSSGGKNVGLYEVSGACQAWNLTDNPIIPSVMLCHMFARQDRGPS